MPDLPVELVTEILSRREGDEAICRHPKRSNPENPAQFQSISSKDPVLPMPNLHVQSVTVILFQGDKLSPETQNGATPKTLVSFHLLQTKIQSFQCLIFL